VALLTAYLDESGTDGRSGVVAVAGYVSTAELWDSFQCQWSDFLTKNGINVFHATDLIAGYGEFTNAKGWGKKRREAALQIADKLIAKYVLHGVGTYTTIADCEKFLPLRDDNGTRKKFSAEYLTSGVMAVNLITSWAEERGYEEPINFVFEDGVKGKGYLLEATKHAKRQSAIRGHLIGEVLFGDKKKLPQLHAADRLAHLFCKSLNCFLVNENSNEGMRELSTIKLNKVHVMDSENFPLLAKKMKLDSANIYEYET
jgi:hypothetical protein